MFSCGFILVNNKEPQIDVYLTKLQINIIIPNTKPKHFLDNIRIKEKFNIFWYENGTGSHENIITP